MINTITSDRYNFIGGSDIPVLLGVSKFKTAEHLINEYSSNSDYISIDSEYTLYGSYMEDIIRNYINEEMNLQALPDCKIDEKKHIRCNVDGYDINNNCIIEIKTNNGKHTNTIDYEVQMQLYMWMFNVDFGYLCMYKRPDNFYTGIIASLHNEKKYFDLTFNKKHLKIKKIKKNEQLIKLILLKIEEFWETVNKKKENNK